MRKAIELLPLAEELNEVPVAALIVKDGEVIASGYNRRGVDGDPTAHAEIMALRAAGKNVIKLTRGYVFNTEYLLSADKIYTQETHYFEVDDFVTAFSFKQIALISDILKNRILEYHMERGVHFEDMASAFIGCDVKIGKGVTVGPNNVVKGNTYIKDNVVLGANNVLDTCIVEEGARVLSSHVSGSYIGENSVVGPFAHIRTGSIIGPSCVAEGCVLAENSVLEEGTCCVAGNITRAESKQGE